MTPQSDSSCGAKISPALSWSTGERAVAAHAVGSIRRTIASPPKEEN